MAQNLCVILAKEWWIKSDDIWLLIIFRKKFLKVQNAKTTYDSKNKIVASPIQKIK